MARAYVLAFILEDAVLDLILEKSGVTRLEFRVLCGLDYLIRKVGKGSIPVLGALLEKGRHDYIYRAMKGLEEKGAIERFNENKLYHGQENEFTLTGKGSYLIRNYEAKLKEKMESPILEKKKKAYIKSDKYTR